ncbi:MAG: alpha/beta hydrolase [Desulfobacterales bacterium]|nr:alpha/beta hydrolase [Deltaproteobacteria bacterium]MBT8362540.1 alpha/beta hydrolase [Deltaproteobacteria bacterium]NNK96739.1 alpha/beta hydrolase [Desulfobacterales bacterium]
MKKLITAFSIILFAGLAAATALGYLQQAQVLNLCPPPGKFISVEQNRIHYIERDGGEIPVVFLHGASSNSRDWQNSLYGNLPNYFHLIAIDRPGLGHSQRNSGNKFHEQVLLIHKIIGEFELDKPILVVHSLSGVIGARLLSDYPDDYRGLIIIAGATYPIGDGSSWYTKLAALPGLGQIFRYSLVPTLAPLISSASVEASFYPQPALSDYKQQSCLELLFSPKRFLANAEDLNQIRPYLDESYPLYTKIVAPVSLIYGDQDQVIYQFSHAGGFKYKVPHAKYIMLPETGHLPHYFRQEVVRQELERIASAISPN